MSKYINNLLDHRVIVDGRLDLYPGCFVEISEAEAESEVFTSLVAAGLISVLDKPSGRVNGAPEVTLTFASDDPSIKGYSVPPVAEKVVAEAPAEAGPIEVQDISAPAETTDTSTDSTTEETVTETEPDGSVVTKKRGRKAAAA